MSDEQSELNLGFPEYLGQTKSRGLMKQFGIGDICYSHFSTLKGKRLRVVAMRAGPSASGWVCDVAVEGEDRMENGICGGWLWPVEDKTSIPHYPHKCPKCGFKAFIGFRFIDCVNMCFK